MKFTEAQLEKVFAEPLAEEDYPSQLGNGGQLGSGIPKILEWYGKEWFQFSDNFLRVVFPSAGPVFLDEQEGLGKGLGKEWVKGLVKAQRELEFLRSRQNQNVKENLSWLDSIVQPVLQFLQENFRKGSGKTSQKKPASGFLILALLAIDALWPRRKFQK